MEVLLDPGVLLGLGVGLGLAAACGFRIFVPLLLMSLAARSGYLEVHGDFEWVATTPAVVGFGVATVLEIGAYYVPWLDNLLDTLAGPTALVAGVLATAATLTDVGPLLRWSLAVVAGGGVAATAQGATTTLRQLSSVTTLGLGNALLATAELTGSVFLAAMAILVPLAALVVLVIALGAAAIWLVRRRGRERLRHRVPR